MALNFGPPAMTFEALGSLGKTFQDAQAAAQKRGIEQQKQQLLSGLGQGSGDFQKVGLGLIGAGDVQSGVALLGLAQKDKERQAEAEWFKGISGGASSAPSAPTSPAASIGNPNEVESRFIGGVKQAGLVNPVGLAAVAAYGKAESGFSPQNVNRTWNDPSESGQPGQSGGILSWRADRLQKLQSFAAQRGEQGNGSPETQATFLAQEDPTLIPRLNAAQTPQEANQIMANAWRFAGYNREGGENARRLALTQQYAGRFGAGGGQPPAAVPLGSPLGVQVAETEADTQRIEAQMPGYGGQAPVGAGGVYAGVDEATLNGYLNNPRVPPNLKALVQQELASRQGGGAPVQVAQAPAQAGAPVADVPAAGARPAQGFAVPGATPQQAQSIRQDPTVQYWAQMGARAPSDRARAYAKQQMDLAVEDAKRRSELDKPTEETRNFEAYRQDEIKAGREPLSRLDYLKAKRMQITNNIGADEKEYDKQSAKDMAEMNRDMIKGAQSANQKIATLNRLETLLTNPAVKTGAGAQLALQAQRVAKSVFGIDTDGLSGAEAVNAISNQFALELRNPSGGAGMPGALSDKDREFLAQSTPGLERTEGGNRLIIDYMRRVAKRSVEVEALRREYIKTNKRLDEGFFDKLAEYSEKNPLFPEAAQAPAAAQSGAVQPPAQAAPQQPAARPPGSQPRTAINPNTGQRVMETPDGKWIPVDG